MGEIFDGGQKQRSIDPDVSPKVLGSLGLKVVGDHPCEVDAQGKPKNTKGCLYIGRGEVPMSVLSTCNGLHRTGQRLAIGEISRDRADEGMAEMDPIDLAVKTEGENYVPLHFIVRGGQVQAHIRVGDDTRNLYKYPLAVELLESIGFKRKNIKFMGSSQPEVREAVKRFGGTHMLDTIDLDDSTVDSYLRNCRQQINPGGNSYWYVPSSGTRLFTYESAKQVLEDADDKDRFLLRIEEVARHYKSNNSQGRKEVNFLFMDGEGNRVRQSRMGDTLCQKLEDISGWGRQQSQWNPEDAKKQYLDFLRLYSIQTSSKQELREEDLSDEWVRQRMYYVLRDIREDELPGLSIEFKGDLKILPGGFIGDRTPGGRLHVGPIGLEEPLDEETMALVDAQEGEYAVIRPHEFSKSPRRHTHSTHTFKRGDALEERHWVFDRKCDPETMQMLNEALAVEPGSDYCFFANVPISRSKRPPLPEDIREYGEPRRGVSVKVSGSKEDGEHWNLRRRIKYDDRYWIARGLPRDAAESAATAYVFNVHARCLLAMALWNASGLDGATKTREDIVPFTRTLNIDSSSKGRRSYSEREFVQDGIATNTYPFASYADIRFVTSLAGVMGETGALEYLTRRFFGDGDEVAIPRNGNPEKVMLVDTTSSFKADAAPEENPDRFAIWCAGETAKAYSKNRWDLIWGWPTLGEITESFRAGFVESLQHMKQLYADNRGAFDSYADDLVRAAPQDVADAVDAHPEFDLRRGPWGDRLRRLRDCDPEKVGQMICRRSNEFLDSYMRALTAAGRQEPQIVDELTQAFMVNAFEHKGFDADYVHSTIMGDNGLIDAEPEERLRRVRALKNSSWIVRVGRDPVEVADYALGFRKRGICEDQTAKSFAKCVNDRFPGLNMPKNMAHEFYGCFSTEEEIRELSELGYIVRV